MEHALESAESIFVGRVVALEEIPDPTQDFVPNDTRVTFFVTKVWKGAREPAKTVATKAKQVKAAKNKAYWLPLSIATRRNEFWKCRKNVVCQRATTYACQVFSGTPGIRVFCR